MSGCAVIALPSSSPPETTLSTPGGRMSRHSSPSLSVHSGVKGDDLTTIVLPVINAGAIFHTASKTGKFQGTMAPTTPSGVCRVTTCAAESSSPILDTHRRHCLEPGDRAQDLPLRSGARLALFAREQRHERLGMPLEGFANASDRVLAACERSFSPLPECRARRGDGVVQLLHGAIGNLRDGLASGGVERGKAALACDRLGPMSSCSSNRTGHRPPPPGSCQRLSSCGSL